jgi:hypothetical protein
MAVDVVKVRSRDKRALAKAEKAKREKIALAVCGVILLALVAFEGPKTLKKLHHTSAASTPAVPAAPAGAAASGAATGATAAHSAPTLARIKKLPAKDPFVAQLGASTGAPVQTSSVAPPAVRAAHFVAKDPFVQQLTLEQPTTSTAAPVAPPASGSQQESEVGANGHYIIVLASVPLADGKQSADRAAAAARKAGVADVRIVNSSSYPTLRTGFYAVYSGPYPTLGVLQSALQKARGQGYPSAYTRRLAR